MFQILKTPVYGFDLYGRYRSLWTDENNFWLCYLKLVYKPNIKFGVNRTFHVRYTDLTYMGGTEPCEPMRIVFGSAL